MEFLKKSIQPVLLILLVLAAARSISMVSALDEVTPLQASGMVAEQQAIIIDVREQDEWDDQHIPGAVHIPLGEVQNRIDEIVAYKGQPIIMQCRSGRRSATAAGILEEAGFQDVSNLSGGIIAWSEAGLPTQ